MADGDYYSAKVDIFNIYGEKNATIWADSNNTRNNRTEIEGRFDWANLMAKTTIDARLYRGPYLVPFTAPYPTMIVLISGTLAGLFLYDTRMITSSEDRQRVPQQRKNVLVWINQIMSGRLKLIGLPLQSENTPRVLEVDADGEVLYD